MALDLYPPSMPLLCKPKTIKLGQVKSQGLGRAKPWLMALTWPEVQESQSHLRPSQSCGFQAEPGQNSTTRHQAMQPSLWPCATPSTRRPWVPLTGWVRPLTLTLPPLSQQQHALLPSLGPHTRMSIRGSADILLVCWIPSLPMVRPRMSSRAMLHRQQCGCVPLHHLGPCAPH
jgi:hypothetical protein